MLSSLDPLSRDDWYFSKSPLVLFNYLLTEDDLFADVYAQEGQPTISPWQLALASAMQFAENLSDQQAAEAVRSWIDWVYTWDLELTDSGFHYSVLSEFRARLVQGSLEQLLLDRLLECCRKLGWLKAPGRQRTDTTHVTSHSQYRPASIPVYRPTENSSSESTHGSGHQHLTHWCNGGVVFPLLNPGYPVSPLLLPNC